MATTGSQLATHSAPASRWQIFLLCALVAVCDGFDTQAIAFVAPVIVKQWGIAPAGFGPVFSAGLIGLALGAFLFGSAADRIGRKAIILLCVGLFGAGSILTTQANDMTELALWRVATGLGLGGVLPNLISMTNEVAAEKSKNSLVMLMFCGFPLGATIGGLVSAPLIEALGWQAVFLLGGILPLVLLPALFLCLPGATGQLSQRLELDGASPPVGKISDLFAERRALPTLLLWVAFFSNLLVMYFLVNWLPSLLTQLGSSLSVATLSTALLNLGGIAGAVVLSRLINRDDSLLLLACAFLAGAMSLVLIALAEGHVALMLTGAALAGSIIVGGQIAMNAVTASFYPARIRSTGVGWALGIGRIGSIIGPLLGGLLLGSGWKGTSLVLFAVGPTLAAAAALFGLRHILRMAAMDQGHRAPQES
jgi:MFS transporter, AAHS family, 4-hydroxybenzoate transporter